MVLSVPDDTAVAPPYSALTEFCRLALEESAFTSLGARACEVVCRIAGCDEGALLWHGFPRAPRIEEINGDVLRGGPAEYAAASGRAVVFEDVGSETRFDARGLAARGIASGIVVPLGPEGAPAGALAALSRVRRPFHEGDIAMIQAVAAMVGIVVARMRAQREGNATAGLHNVVCELSQDGIAIVDVGGRIVYLNPAMAVLLGGTRTEWEGAELSRVLVPEDRGVIAEWLAGRGVTRQKLRIVGGEGAVLWASTAASPLFDERRQCIGAAAVFKDVTMSLRNAEEIRRRDAQLAEAQSVAHLGSWELDLETGQFQWSDELYRIGGMDPQSRKPTIELAAELVGAPACELLAVFEGLAPGEMTDRDYEVHALDGTLRQIRVRARRLSDVPRSNIVVGAVQDVTDHATTLRRQAELSERLERAAFEWRMTFDSIPAPILLLDDEARVLRLNAAALRLSQFDDYRLTLGQEIDRLGPAAVWAELRRIVDATVTSRDTLALRTRDAAGRWWEVVTSPWLLNGVWRVTVFATDVTGLARMQESLQRSERMSALGALVSGVAHEVRNPLFAISATLDAIQATGSQEVPSRFTGALRDQVNRMNELLQELLEYGRPQPAQQTVDDLRPLVSAARVSVRTLAEKSGVAIVIHTAAAPLPVRMDRGRLLQVFENLLRNAIQHAPGGSSVEVRAGSDAAGAVVTVEDRGPGIAAEDLTRIFQPFFSRRRGGTGLGLSLAQRIVEDHEGTIEAANRDGGGAIMTVRLPLAPEEPAP